MYVGGCMDGIGKRIREARLANGYTQSELASLLGCNVNTISRWEHDKYVPSSFEIGKISEVLGIDLTKPNDDTNESASNSLELSIEDIRLEIANSYRQKFRTKLILMAAVMIALFLIYLYFANHIDSKNSDGPVTIIYYLEEGETIG